MDIRGLLKVTFLSLIINSCVGQGIYFEKNLCWSDIKEKAKAENKKIFIDCYASWCVPCRLMDENIYSLDSLGSFVNENFISVKVQLDETPNDNEEIKSWRADARYIESEYKIKIFPSFLFLTPEGDIIHRDIGYKDETAFKEMAEIALDTAQQFKTKLQSYKEGRLAESEFQSLINLAGINGDERTKTLVGKDLIARKFNLFKKNKLDFADMPNLIDLSALFGENDIKMTVGRFYMQYYINKLTAKQLCETINASFVSDHLFLLNSNDLFFSMCYNNPIFIDSISPGFAAGVVRNVVRKEMILPFIPTDTVNIKDKYFWEKIRKSIARKFDQELANLLVLNEQIVFYERMGNLIRFSELYDAKLYKYPPKKEEIMPPFGGPLDQINETAWTIFEKSADPKVLKRALKWSKLTVDMGEGSGIYHFLLDTYANLLYKLGDKVAAINYQKQAVQAKIKANGNTPLSPDDGSILTLHKMEKGRKTWP